MTAPQDTTAAHQPAATGLRRLTGAYRRMYCRLPPGVQLVGLQLWLPLVFIVLFCLCYIQAFHAPTVNHAPIGVVAPADSPAVAALRHATGQTFDYRPYGSADAARRAVRDGVVIGALVHPGGPDPTLYVASAHQYQAKTIVTNTLGPVYAATHRRLTVTDLAPLPRHDSFGMTTMYLMLAWCIGGYMVAMFIGLLVPRLADRHQDHQRREVRRILAGRTTMFADAQAANREHAHAIRERVLAHYGVGSEPAESTQDEDELAGDALSNYGRPLSPCEQEPPAPSPPPDRRARTADATPPEVSRPAPGRADRRAGPAR